MENLPSLRNVCRNNGVSHRRGNASERLCVLVRAGARGNTLGCHMYQPGMRQNSSGYKRTPLLSSPRTPSPEPLVLFFLFVFFFNLPQTLKNTAFSPLLPLLAKLSAVMTVGSLFITSHATCGECACLSARLSRRPLPAPLLPRCFVHVCVQVVCVFRPH